MIIWQGFLTVKEGQRQAYLDELLEHDLIRIFRAQKGNVFYSIAACAEDDSTVVVCDGWETKEDFTAHDGSAEVAIWREIYARYVTDCKAQLFEASVIG